MSDVEGIKVGSGLLRGSLAGELEDPAPAFAPETTQVLKFHGVYQEDDRDARAERRAAGLDRDWIFMVRAAVPGGRLTADQYLAMDRLADQVGDGSLRVTSRQGIQWHHTRKSELRPLIKTLNEHLVTTLGACGDVVRNTMACPAPLAGREAVAPFVDALARYFRPRTSAYYEIWIDGERAVTAEAPVDGEIEPVYGPSYLPRKFKIALAHPGDNCVDVYAGDLGIVPSIESGRVSGFTLLVGGGMGRSHNKPDTFPRLADPFAWVEPDELVEVVEAIVGVQRDFGERTDRKHARLKYLVSYWGLDDFRRAVELRLGRALEAARALSWETADDHLGWHEQAGGGYFVGVPVENGRIRDAGSVRLRTGMRAVVERHGHEVRLTPNQSVLLCGIAGGDRDEVDRILADHGVRPAAEVPLVIRTSMACVALPTCSLAVADAERALPRVIRQLDRSLAALGLDSDAPRVRMTGCPNGCARPYNAEIGLVGRRAGRYDIHLGADSLGLRLNTLVAEAVPEAAIVTMLAPVLRAWGNLRLHDEPFGEFCHRIGMDRVRSILDGREAA